MIKISHLSYKYRDNKSYTLKDIDFTINDGEVIALVGENGSGKSTLGRIIAGILPMQQGSVKIDDTEYTAKDPTSLRDQLSIVFQNPENQIIFNRIDDEVGFALQNLPEAEVDRRITEVLRRVGMTKHREQDLYSLSLGQKQRIVIAEALARRPKYLILDEPTTMIDSQGKQEIYQLLRKLKNKGYTIICITNLADEILLADRTLILANGTIAAEIKSDELVKKSKLLQKYNIHQPTLLQLLGELEQRGISLKITDFTVPNLADEIATVINKESHANR